MEIPSTEKINRDLALMKKLRAQEMGKSFSTVGNQMMHGTTQPGNQGQNVQLQLAAIQGLGNLAELDAAYEDAKLRAKAGDTTARYEYMLEVMKIAKDAYSSWVSAQSPIEQKKYDTVAKFLDASITKTAGALVDIRKLREDRLGSGEARISSATAEAITSLGVHGGGANRTDGGQSLSEEGWTALAKQFQEASTDKPDDILSLINHAETMLETTELGQNGLRALLRNSPDSNARRIEGIWDRALTTKRQIEGQIQTELEEQGLSADIVMQEGLTAFGELSKGVGHGPLITIFTDLMAVGNGVDDELKKIDNAVRTGESLPDESGRTETDKVRENYERILSELQRNPMAAGYQEYRNGLVQSDRFIAYAAEMGVTEDQLADPKWQNMVLKRAIAKRNADEAAKKKKFRRDFLIKQKDAARDVMGETMDTAGVGPTAIEALQERVSSGDIQLRMANVEGNLILQGFSVKDGNPVTRIISQSGEADAAIPTLLRAYKAKNLLIGGDPGWKGTPFTEEEDELATIVDKKVAPKRDVKAQGLLKGFLKGRRKKKKMEAPAVAAEPAPKVAEVADAPE